MANILDKFSGGAELRKLWMLEEGAHYFNHGAFGACPKPVLAAQQQWRERMERQPTQFLARDLPGLMRAAAGDLAEFLHVEGDAIAFVENATAGVNAVLRSYPWQAGDELVLSQHAYPAVKCAARFVAQQFNLVIREFAVPFPLQEEAQILDGLRAVLNERTRMALLDHISSPLAIIYPLDDMLALCRERGVATLVDGAHVPGMLDLDLSRIDADWYVGNCHKWLFAPRGCAFLWAADSQRSFLQPPVVSARMEEGFPNCFDWVGTREPSPWLSIGAALDFYKQLGGVQHLERIHEQARSLALHVCDVLDMLLPAPEAMFGAMYTLPLPDRLQPAEPATQLMGYGLNNLIWERYRVESPVFAINGRLWMRLSVQAYNSAEDVLALEEALADMLRQ